MSVITTFAPTNGDSGALVGLYMAWTLNAGTRTLTAVVTPGVTFVKPP